MSKSPPQLFVNDGPLDPSQVGFLRPTDPNTTDAEEVRRRLKEDGYIFLKGLLPREDALKTREQYFEYLAPTGSLKPGFRPVNGIFDLSKNKTDFPGIGASEEPFNKATAARFTELAVKAHGEPWYKDQFCQHPHSRIMCSRSRVGGSTRVASNGLYSGTISPVTRQSVSIMIIYFYVMEKIP